MARLLIVCMHVGRRWSSLAAGHTDIQLQLLPMLLGFFTYKAGVIGKQFTELMVEAARPSKAPSSTAGEMHAMSVHVAVLRSCVPLSSACMQMCALQTCAKL